MQSNEQQMQNDELEDYPLQTMMTSQVTHINPLLQIHNSGTQDNLTQSHTNESLEDDHEHYKYRTTRNTIASLNQLLVIPIPRNHKCVPTAIAHSLFRNKALASEICEEVQGELRRNTTSDSQLSISGILDTDEFTKAHLMAAVEYYQVQISVYNCGPDSNEDPAGELQVYTPNNTALAPDIHLFWDGQDHYELGLGEHHHFVPHAIYEMKAALEIKDQYNKELERTYKIESNRATTEYETELQALRQVTTANEAALEKCKQQLIEHSALVWL